MFCYNSALVFILIMVTIQEEICSAVNFSDLARIDNEHIRRNCPIALYVAQNRRTGQLDPERPGGNFFTIKGNAEITNGFPCDGCNLRVLP